LESAPGNNFRAALIRVLIVADSAVVRAGLDSLVSSSQSFVVAGSVSTTEDLAGQIAERQPDLVLADWSNSGGRSLPAFLDVESEITIPIVVVADDLETEWVPERLRAGVRAVLPREAEPAQILSAMESVASGLVVLHPLSLAQMLAALRAGPHALPSLQPLTERELEVLEMLAQGLGNKAIAWKLGISEHTVKYHVASLFDKLNAGSRAEAVAIGIRHGLVMM